MWDKQHRAGIKSVDEIGVSMGDAVHGLDNYQRRRGQGSGVADLAGKGH